jgi:DNA-directed RNA polymerase subunit RPC12/RpoP
MDFLKEILGIEVKKNADGNSICSECGKITNEVAVMPGRPMYSCKECNDKWFKKTHKIIWMNKIKTRR